MIDKRESSYKKAGIFDLEKLQEELAASCSLQDEEEKRLLQEAPGLEPIRTIGLLQKAWEQQIRDLGSNQRAWA